MTKKNTYKILIVDDNREVLKMLSEILSDDYEIVSAESGKEAISLTMSNDDIATIVMDIKMADMDGITAAREIKKIAPNSPVIFHTGYPGDYDEDQIDRQEQPFAYILKGDPISKLTRSVRNAVESYRLKKDNLWLSQLAERNYGLVGRSEAMQEVYSLIHRVAANNSKVMVLGETGTGKELVARAIHNNSPRREQRLAIFNCNHRAPDLVESELFGHVRGSFTGAVADRVGLFEYADGGTVMLDEIGDLDITTQGKILRVLETGEYQRIGSPDTRTTDVRVICATNRDLEQLIETGRFREDLYYRLKGVHIKMPPLRERRDDIPILINHFKDRFSVENGIVPKIFDRSAIDVLLEFNWPGNVRQLLDTVESLIVLTESDIIVAEDVVNYLGINYEPCGEDHPSLATRIKQFRRACVVQALNETGYNISGAAKLLGMDRSNLRKMIREYDITIDRAKARQSEKKLPR